MHLHGVSIVVALSCLIWGEFAPVDTFIAMRYSPFGPLALVGPVWATVGYKYSQNTRLVLFCLGLLLLFQNGSPIV